MTAVRHPIFARVFARMSEREERMGQAEHRRAMLSGVSGRVLELGAGNGINFRRYPAAVSEVVAVEPEPYLRERAEEAARRVATAVRVVDGLGGALPFEDASFDAAVASLVLCTVTGHADRGCDGDAEDAVGEGTGRLLSRARYLS
jgi:ubiquinone/menaquinone biosynthesis C-methylase UbiE